MKSKGGLVKNEKSGDSDEEAFFASAEGVEDSRVSSRWN